MDEGYRNPDKFLALEERMRKLEERVPRRPYAVVMSRAHKRLAFAFWTLALALSGAGVAGAVTFQSAAVTIPAFIFSGMFGIGAAISTVSFFEWVYKENDGPKKKAQAPD